MTLLAQRFWNKVDKSVGQGPWGNCWIWTGAISGGYGCIKYAGRTQKAPRIAWLLHYGKWPNPQALHKCDNPACVRWSHLLEGTQADNVADCAAKGRIRSGNSFKTHCPRGHLYLGDNVYRWYQKRYCRTCHREAERRRRDTARKKSEMVS